MKERIVDTLQSLDAARFAQGSYLIEADWTLLPEGPARGIAAVVKGGRFTDVAPARHVRERHPHLAPLALADTLLMPGFIDTHHHLTQSIGKALAFGEPSEIFRRIWVPMEGALDQQGVYLSAKLSALESLRGGFTTVVDAGTRSAAGLEGVARAARETGIRCVLGKICNDADNRDGQAGFDAILAQAQRFLEDYAGDALVHPSLAISIPEAATDAMLGAVARMALEARASFQTHVNEHLVAVERSLVARGRRPLEILHQAGALNPAALLAHATLLTPHEINLLRDSGAAVCYNPVASSWKGNAVLHAELLDALGIPFGLGTDGTRGDAFRLMDAAETAQRLAFGLASGDSSCGGGWMWLDHATRLGARACGLGGITGAIAPGLAADFLLLDLAVPEMLPSWELEWELVRLANRDQIAAVFVNGAMRLRGGWPVDWDARALMREVARVAREDVARAPIQKIHESPTAGRARLAAMRRA
jgi:cytosine/adenosine deaminase-related metal-dependent hydrolase